MSTGRWENGAKARMLAAGLLVLSVAGLSGCNSIQVHLGMKVYLAKIPVSSMVASLSGDPGIAPGEKTPLVVTFTQPDGKVLTTEGKGKGKVLWADLVVTPAVVKVNKKGVLSLAHDPRKSDGKTGHVVITAPSHPDLKAELDVPLDYDYAFSANYSGSSGTSGTDGTNGIDGTQGSPGSIDPNNPSPGGNGGSGTDGGNGGDGGTGGDAPHVAVVMTLRAGAHPLLQIGVTPQGGKERFYLVDTQGGSLTVTANGGNGGSGGKGGSGGHGGSGGIGTPNGNSGSDGHAGLDGNDGQPGRPGSFTVTYDASAQPYLSALKLVNQGGPKTVFTEATVGPLW
jgi:hypothetical protein